MMKLSCVVVLASSLVLATLAVAAAAAGASSSSSPYIDRHQALVLGRRGRELSQSSGFHYQHRSKHTQHPEEVAMEVKKPGEEEGKGRWTADQGDDAEAGLIYSADYSGVAMHAGSPPTAKPKHRHPKP